MNLKSKYIDELIELRKDARDQKNWILSDKIRAFLDTKHVFVFDTKESQIVYHRKGITRQQLIQTMKIETRAEKMFNCWLYSMQSSLATNG